MLTQANYEVNCYTIDGDGRPTPPVSNRCTVRRQSTTTEEILIARGFRRESTTEDMMRCRNFRRPGQQQHPVVRERKRQKLSLSLTTLLSLAGTPPDAAVA